jgi:hypothetical protein
MSFGLLARAGGLQLASVAAQCHLRRAGVRGDGQGPRRGEDGSVQGF